MISNALITAGLCLAAGAASAQSVPYPDTGTQNAATYSFTATATGQVDAYFAAQTSAYYAEEVELIVSGVPTNNFGLLSHSTATGTAFDLGNVTAGDTLSFAIQVFTSGTGKARQVINFLTKKKQKTLRSRTRGIPPAAARAHVTGLPAAAKVLPERRTPAGDHPLCSTMSVRP
jgi:hypothetical protein